MCTVSWCWHSDGYELFFNRDERHQRAIADPPSIDRQNGFAVLAPRDGDHLGTWLAVNAAGVTVGMLNRYPADPPPIQARSRGLLVMDLAWESSVARIRSSLAGLDLQIYPAFTLIALGTGETIYAATWDGRCLKDHPTVGPPLTSSSHATDTVVASRQALFAEMRRAPATHAGWFDAYHRSHLPEKGAFSVCMHRPDARTVSYSQVRVSNRTAQFHYHADSPCVNTPAAIAELALVSGAAS